MPFWLANQRKNRSTDSKYVGQIYFSFIVGQLFVQCTNSWASKFSLQILNTAMCIMNTKALHDSITYCCRKCLLPHRDTLKHSLMCNVLLMHYCAYKVFEFAQTGSVIKCNILESNLLWIHKYIFLIGLLFYICSHLHVLDREYWKCLTFFL